MCEKPWWSQKEPESVTVSVWMCRCGCGCETGVVQGHPFDRQSHDTNTEPCEDVKGLGWVFVLVLLVQLKYNSHFHMLCIKNILAGHDHTHISHRKLKTWTALKPTKVQQQEEIVLFFSLWCFNLFFHIHTNKQISRPSEWFYETNLAPSCESVFLNIVMLRFCLTRQGMNEVWCFSY